MVKKLFGKILVEKDSKKKHVRSQYLDTLKIIENLKKIQLIPTLFLSIVLYLFSIDIITAMILGYSPKDYLYLIDIKKVVYINSAVLILFTLIGIIIKKSFIASAIAVSILTIIYALYNGLEIEKLLNVMAFLFFFVAALSFNVYDKAVDHFVDKPWNKVLISSIASILMSVFFMQFISNNLNNWKIIEFHNSKIEITKPITAHTLIEAKSLNSTHLQSLNQNLKVYMNSQLSYKLAKQIYGIDLVNSQNYILIPHDGSQSGNFEVTSNYYDVNDVKNIFIINPNSCHKNKCKLHTLITKQVNKNDISKGYQLISKYTYEVELKNTITDKAEEVKGF